MRLSNTKLGIIISFLICLSSVNIMAQGTGGQKKNSNNQKIGNPKESRNKVKSSPSGNRISKVPRINAPKAKLTECDSLMKLADEAYEHEDYVQSKVMKMR